MRRAAAASALILVALALAQPARDALAADAPRTPLSPAAGTEGLAGSVLTGSFRPLLLTYLWLRGDVLYGEGRHEECFELYRLLFRLYPGNARARDFVGWFLAFDLKNKAPDVALGWKWAEEGLDLLLESPEGPSIVADWIRKQCGQNSVVLERYAGPAWQEERAWRARLRGFGERHFGEDLSRFALGVRVLEGRGGILDRGRRALLLRSLAYEEMLRYGSAPHAAEAVEALREMAKEMEDEERLHTYFSEKARCLEEAVAGRKPSPLPEAEVYPVAMALWGRGVKDRDPATLREAEALLNELAPEELAQEIELIRGWLAHLEARGPAAAPPMPFDGMR